MKIAIAVKNYSKTGGISRYVAELAQRYAENDEVHIFASTWRDVSNSRIVFHKVPMLDFKFLKRLKKYAWNNLFEVASFVLFSYFKIDYSQFDIVHIQGDFMGKFDLYTAHSCHKAWLEVARKEKLNILERFKKSAFNPLHSIILKIEKHNVRNAKKIISLSHGEKKAITEYYGIPSEKIIPIPHGVALKDFNAENSKAMRGVVRDQFGLGKDNVVLIFSAHEFKRKGLFQIIEAMNMLKEGCLYLLVAGRDSPGPYFNLIEKYGLSEKIIFTGPVSNIQDYYSAGDIFIMPTVYEPFGLVILEAMASGLPVITSKTAGAAELIDDGTEGLLLQDARDPAEVADKVMTLIKIPDARRRMGREARRKAEKYSWDYVAGQTYKIYKKVFEEKTG